MFAINKGVLGTAGVALLFFAVAFSGCNSSPNVIMGYEKAGGGVATDILIANGGLQRDIAIDDAKSRRVNDLLQASIQLISREKKTVNFEYKFQWFDADGFEISDPKSHWAPEMIHGRDRLQVQQLAPSPKAFTFKLLIREPAPIKR